MTGGLWTPDGERPHPAQRDSFDAFRQAYFNSPPPTHITVDDINKAIDAVKAQGAQPDPDLTRIDASKMKLTLHYNDELLDGEQGTSMLRAYLDEGRIATYSHVPVDSEVAQNLRGGRHEVLDPPRPCQLKGCSGQLVWRRELPTPNSSLGVQFCCTKEHPWYSAWEEKVLMFTFDDPPPRSPISDKLEQAMLDRLKTMQFRMISSARRSDDDIYKRFLGGTA